MVSRSRCLKRAPWTAVCRAAGVAVLLGVSVTIARADNPPTFTPTGDDFKGTTLDPKWTVTVMGDDQADTNSVTVKDGALSIVAGGSDIWTDNDNGIFIWQPANGDFQVVLETRSITKISDALNSNKIGIMVRPSLDNHDKHVYVIAMPKGTHIQARTDVGAQAGPSSSNRVPWGFGDGTGVPPGFGSPLQLRLTRKGNTFTGERSDDGGKTWGSLHTAGNANLDTVTVAMPDDVLVGIMVGAIHGTSDDTLVTAVAGPFQFTQLATRPSGNGLLAATATDANGAPVTGSSLIVGQGMNVLANTLTSAGPSDTGSWFLPPEVYSISTPDTQKNAAGAPVPFEIKAPAQVLELKVPVGSAK